MSISVAPKINPASIQQSLLPGQTCAFDLGSINLQWRNLFLNQFLSLLSTGGSERRLQEKVGDVQLTDNLGVLLRSLNTDILPTTLSPASVATIGITTSYARGDHVHGIDVSISTGFDGRYIKRSPTGENQAILPLTDNVPLTIKGFAGGTSDILRVFDSTSPAQVLRWNIDSSGNLIVSDSRIDISRSATTLAAYRLFLSGEAQPRLAAFPSAGGSMPAASIEMGPGGAVSPSLAFGWGGAGILRIGQGVFGWPGGTLAQLALQGAEGGNAERRIRENAGALEVTDITPTVLRSLLLDVAPSTLGPSSVTTIGISTGYSRGDHIHGIDTSIATGFDGRYIKRSPSAESQTILPLTDSLPLTIKGFAGGTSDVLDIYDAASPQNQIYRFMPNGDLQVTLFSSTASPALFKLISGLTISQTLLQRTGIGGVSLGSPGDSPTIIWTVNGDSVTFNTSFIKNNIYKAPNSDTIIDTSFGLLNFGISTRLLSIFASNTLIGSKLRVGDTTTLPLQVLEARGSIPSLVLDGSEASGVRLRLRENAGLMDVTDDTPTQLRVITTRGNKNISVGLNATSISVVFASSEADTSYEITTNPSWNSTTWYTSKTTTGFTINFNTAAPAGATVDWHIERIPRT